jgi:hypothetical protein
MRIILLIAAAVAAAVASATPVRAAAPPPALTSDQWREDLRFMAAEMERRHVDLYHHVSRADFKAAVADLDARIPSLQRNQIIVGMMHIAAMVGDGHTRIEPRKDKAFQFPSVPIKLYDFDDGIFVRAVAPGQEALLGAKLEAVGGVPIAEAWKRIEPLVSGDNQMAARMMVPIYLAMPDILQAVGLSGNRDAASMTFSRNGRRWTVDLHAGAVDPPWPADTDISLVTPAGWVDAAKTVPMWLQEPLNLHRLIPVPERSFVYAQLNQGVDYKGESLDAYGNRIAALARQQNPRAVIFDVRLNYGGNGDLRSGLMRDLIRLEDDDTRLFVLTARGSFSATQFMLDDLSRLSHAVLVGEPASGRPTSYGDAYRSVLPNSGITVRTSIRYWKNGQDDRAWTPVDVAVPYRFADYAAGRDPVLEAAISHRPSPSLLDRLNAAAKTGGGTAAVAALSTWADDPVHRYSDFTGDAARSIGQMDDNPSALAASRWFALRYPANGDAQTLYALLAQAVGTKADALAAAKAALAIDPSNRQARSVLEWAEAPAKPD